MDGEVDLTTALLLKQCPPRDGSAEKFLSEALGYTESRLRELFKDELLSAED